MRIIDGTVLDIVEGVISELRGASAREADRVYVVEDVGRFLGTGITPEQSGSGLPPG